MKWRQKQDDIDLKSKEDLIILESTKLKNKFPKFNEAVRKKDWQKASEECHIHNIGVLRN